MANFNTHLNVAAIASVGAAVTLYSLGTINISSLAWLSFLGIIGGLAPDMDSGHSRSIKVIFTVLAILTSIGVCYQMYNKVSIIELIPSIIGTFVIVRFAVKKLFSIYSVHRGSCHSIMFSILIGCCMIAILNSLKFDIIFCWLSGVFLTGGCIVHLTLDEIYSIDINKKRIKSSFGTALKLMSFKNPFVSTIQTMAIGFLMYVSPALNYHHLEKLINSAHFFYF